MEGFHARSLCDMRRPLNKIKEEYPQIDWSEVVPNACDERGLPSGVDGEEVCLPYC